MDYLKTSKLYSQLDPLTDKGGTNIKCWVSINAVLIQQMDYHFHINTVSLCLLCHYKAHCFSCIISYVLSVTVGHLLSFYCHNNPWLGITL